MNSLKELVGQRAKQVQAFTDEHLLKSALDRLDTLRSQLEKIRERPEPLLLQAAEESLFVAEEYVRELADRKAVR